jgi:hypothetical protein
MPERPTGFSVILQRFKTEFGPPYFPKEDLNDRHKAVGWYDEQTQSGWAILCAGRGTVVLPFRRDEDAEPPFMERLDPPRPDRRGRSTALQQASPALSWDKWLLYLDLWFENELSLAVEIVKGRQKGQLIPFIPSPILPSPTLDGLPPPMSEIKRAIWRRDGGRCVDCGSSENLHFDEEIPRDRGGSVSLENTRLLCRACNLRKSNRL